MSADLFAEFGSASNSSAPPSQPQSQTRKRADTTFGFFDNAATAPTAPCQPAPQPIAPSSNVQQDFDDNDDWGDFEGDDPGFVPPPLQKQDSFAFVATAARARAPTLSTFEEGLEPFSPTGHKAPVLKAKTSTNPSVLFDAEDDFDDDDFGDFEEPESFPKSTGAIVSHGSSGIADLLGDLDLSQSEASKRPHALTLHSISTVPASLKSPIGGFGRISPGPQAKPPPAPSAPKEEDAWDTFDDWEASIPAKAPKKVPSKMELKKNATTVISKVLKSPLPVVASTFADPQPGELPPTNVPPPAVLLTLFPPLFADAQEKLFKPMAAQTLPMRNKVLSDPATITYLQGYIMLASVAAHIIAGRKLRWKRDQHLSQGMRIGPASSRATSGMKLSSIDRSENMKEEREASDVVRAWKDQIGRLRHVVSAANQIRAGSLGTVPDIQEVMPVKVLKQVEGGVPAREPCMLCGLKRDERVGSVDQGVEDSFGEWWVEQVNMHRSCRNFWGEHKDRLRQR